MLRTMTFDELVRSMWPWISAPHSPTMVLFEPIVTVSAESTPLT